MRHRFFAILTIFILLSPSAVAAPDMAMAKIPNAKIVGEGILSYAFWDVYRAALYAPNGQWDPRKSFALSIEYFRDIKGSAIADRSVQEMRKQGLTDEVRLAAWHAQMKSIFPDVKNGTVLSAAYIPGRETIFYNNGRKIGAIQGYAFADHFFSIWLGENTSEPSLRRALLGVK